MKKMTHHLIGAYVNYHTCRISTILQHQRIRSLHTNYIRNSSEATALSKKSSPKLVREWIHDALYEKDQGYFTTNNREVLYAPDNPIDFNNLWGAWEYKKAVSKLYNQTNTNHREAWLTPVEIFAPYYSYGIANYMMHSPAYKLLDNTSKDPPGLIIYEIGGGAGTNALYILNYLERNFPYVYAKTSYTLIEISPVMATRQEERVVKAHPKQAKVVNESILTYEQVINSKRKETQSCFVLAMEVLDNLPHDKVTIKNGKWYETVITGNKDEKLQPLQDPLIQETLAAFAIELPLQVQYKYKSNVVQNLRKLLQNVSSLAAKQKNSTATFDMDLNSTFIPTGAMQFFQTLSRAFPKHHLIAADFDALPAPSIDTSASNMSIYPLNHMLSPTALSSGPLCAGNAPLVASKVNGNTFDHDTYLIDSGIADIFFATDFGRLKKAYLNTVRRQSHEVSIVKSTDFFKAFGDLKRTKTMTGYNPLIDDYTNTSFILS